jgi:hypothetical protein
MQHFKRNFRLWDFKVSHDQLLLRSPKNAENPKNLDVAFVGVEYIELPTKLKELTVGEAGDDDFRRADLGVGKAVPRNQVFVIESGGRRYVVVAAAMKVSETDLDLFESSLERFG